MNSLSLLRTIAKHMTFPSLKSRPSKNRRLAAFRLEELESRTVLSATLSGEAMSCSLEDVDVAIRDVTLTVNGHEMVLSKSESTVVVDDGDVIGVHAVGYDVKAAASCQAVIAAEAYFRKGDEFDYGDGRFGDTRGSDPFAEKTMALTLSGDWQVEDDWDRMSIPLLGYADDDVKVYHRFFINFDVVDERDAAFSLSETLAALFDTPLVAGQSASLRGAWANNGESPQTADMEVEIFAVSLGLTPVWTGRFTATALPGESVVGVFVDANGDRWSPSSRGIYVLRFSVDPDDVIIEWNEWNNWGLLPSVVVS